MTDIYKGDNAKYSVWLSTEPYNSSGNTFIHLCSDATVNYNLSYSMSATGVLGNSTDKTIVVDSASGAIGNISVSGTRVNPGNSTDTIANVSNAEFQKVMINLLTRIQMHGNAYVLRIFRADWRKTVNPYRDLYVFFYNYDQITNWDHLNEMSVNFAFYRRNLGRGFRK